MEYFIERIKVALEDKDAKFKKEVKLALEEKDSRYNKEIDKIQKMSDFFTEKLTQIEKSIPLINKALEAEGLEVSSISYGKTGIGDKLINDGDKLRFTINAVPFEGSKFKFIAFAGYTKSGAGKNTERLNDKAKKMQDKFKESTGIPSCVINYFSLESGGQRKNLRVIYEIYL